MYLYAQVLHLLLKKSLPNTSWTGSFYSGSYLRTFSNMQFSEVEKILLDRLCFYFNEILLAVSRFLEFTRSA